MVRSRCSRWSETRTKSNKRLVSLPEAFDGELTRYLLNVLNGTLDLK